MDFKSVLLGHVFFMCLFRCFILLQEWEINSPLIEGKYSHVLRVGNRNRERKRI